MSQADMQARFARWEAQDRTMQTIAKVGAYAIVAVLALTFYLAFDHNAAMKQCQAKGFSYETCFHSLNR